MHRNPCISHLATEGKSAKAVEKLGREAAERLAPWFPRRLLLKPEQNKLTSECKMLYIAAPPTTTPKVSFMNGCEKPAITLTNEHGELEPHSANALSEYLMTKLMLSLHVMDTALGLVPGKPRIKKFKRYLNLSGLLHAATEMLPDGAYSVALLIDIDLYEDPEDDFCCGSSYGASYVCIVSSARYHPSTSHCNKFADGLGAVEDLNTRTYVKSAIVIAKCVLALIAVEARNGLWLSRILAHWPMNSCIAEDPRQPSRLCPVCLGNVAYAIACELELLNQTGKERYVEENYEAMAKFCEAWKHVGLLLVVVACVQARLLTTSHGLGE
ncbi:hypothetical protein F5Y09DRAFT_336585 [Xylaria sp. FL1042]|nr:hypothetical protein F5Y09DRAFT_336585 [Xylaria sp. FL1042]